MEYIKSYEGFNTFKNGDIVVLNKEELYNTYNGIHPAERRIRDFLVGISDIQRIYLSKNSYDFSYYFKNNKKKSGKFSISGNQILRLANDKEKEKFYMEENMDIFNI